ncbi:hypothetical protein K438DRAFT_1771634 [Mycena galopus ATCC 62051]|nr:hypothetical protein K438DRAFT_1771634 [Mycena galopus ATCC 62051]
MDSRDTIPRNTLLQQMPRNDPDGRTMKTHLSLLMATAQITIAFTTSFFGDIYETTTLLGIIAADRALDSAPKSVAKLLYVSSCATLLFNTMALGASQLAVARLTAVTLDDQGKQSTDTVSVYDVLGRNGAGRFFKGLIFQCITYMVLGALFTVIQLFVYLLFSEDWIVAMMAAIFLVCATVLLAMSWPCQ